MKALDLAKRYFDLSNESNLGEIRKLMTDSTTYSSENSGIYLGVDAIMKMQGAFHGTFESLSWQINDVREIKPGVVCFDFVFVGKTKAGEEVTRPGIEYVVVHKGKLQHIEVRNRALPA